MVSWFPVSASAPWAGNISRQNWWEAGRNLNPRQKWRPWTVLPLLSTAGCCFSSRRWSRCSGSQPTKPTPQRGLSPGQSVGDALSLPLPGTWAPQILSFCPHSSRKRLRCGNYPHFLAVIRCLLTGSLQLLLISEWRFHVVPFSRSTSSLTTFCSILWFSLRPVSLSKCLGGISILISIKYLVFDWRLG